MIKSILILLIVSTSIFANFEQTMILEDYDNNKSTIIKLEDNILTVDIFDRFGRLTEVLSGELSKANGDELNGNMTSFTSDEGQFMITTGLVPKKGWFASPWDYDKRTSIHLIDERGLSNYYLGCLH